MRSDRLARRAVAVVGILLLGAGGWLLRSSIADTVSRWSTSLRDLAEGLPDLEIDDRVVRGASTSVLLVLGSGPDDAAFALVVLDPGAPPSIVMLPQEMLVSVPGFGEFTLADALVFAGPQLVELAVTNQFGVRIDTVVAIPTGGVAAALSGPIEIDVPVPLFADDGSGVQRVVPEGLALHPPDVAERMLVTRGEGDPFEWIQRQGAVWESVLAAIAVEPRVADRLSSGVAADLLVTIAADPERRVATIPVERTPLGGGMEALAPGDGASTFVADRLGHLVLRPEGRPRVEVLNGNGRVGTTAPITEALVRRGFRIIRTDNADSFSYTTTQVIAQGPDAEAAAREVFAILSTGELFLELRAPSNIVDVSIIVASDIPAGEG